MGGRKEARRKNSGGFYPLISTVKYTNRGGSNLASLSLSLFEGRYEEEEYTILLLSFSKGHYPAPHQRPHFFEPSNETSERALALNLLPPARGRSPVMLPTPVDSGNQQLVRGGGRGKLGSMVFQLEALRPRSLG